LEELTKLKLVVVLSLGGDEAASLAGDEEDEELLIRLTMGGG
jgi:hypothetical protein